MALTKRKKGLLLFSGVALAGFGFWSYVKIKQILTESIKFNRVVTKGVNFKKVSFNLFVNITNPSKIPVTILSQSYIAYINNTAIARGQSQIAQDIKTHSTSVLGMAVSLQPIKLGTALLKQLVSNQLITVQIVVKIKIKISFFTFTVPYTYRTTLKELLGR